MNVIPNPRTISTVAVAALVLLSVFAVAPVASQDDDPEPVPASFHGEVYVDGDPAPAGTEIVAEIDGEERGSIVTDEDGVYGDATVGGEKLVVEGENDDDGAEITFLVDGQAADQTATWQAETNTELHLVVGEPPEDPPGDGEDDDEDGGGGVPSLPSDDDEDDDTEDGDDSDGDGSDTDDDSSTAGNGDDGDGDGSDTDDDSSADDGDDSDDATDDDNDDDDGLPGFGVVGAVVGLLLVAILAGRRQ